MYNKLMKAGDHMVDRILKRRILIAVLVVVVIAILAASIFFISREMLFPKYTVTLDANGGTVEQSQIELRYNKAYTLPTPYLKGFSFYCWTCNGEYVPLAGIWEKEGDVTLTANWEYRDENSVVYSKTEEGFLVETVRGKTYQEIIIPKEYQGVKVVGIKEGAFDSLKDFLSTSEVEYLPIYVPSTVTQIGKDVFYNEKMVKKPYDEFHQTDDYTYLEYNGELEILAYKGGFDKDLIIPEKYSEMPVTKIGKYVFLGTESKINQSSNTFFRLFIPTTVKLIDTGAFDKCGGVKSSLYYYNENGAFRELTDLAVIIDWLDNCKIEDGNKHLADVISLLRAAIGWSKYSAARIYVKFDTDGGVIYDANGKELERYSQEMKIGSKYTLLTPTKEGFTFEGWFLDGQRVEPSGDRWKISSHVTLVAKWTENTNQ